MNIHHELPPPAKPTDWAVLDSEWYQMEQGKLHRPTTGHFACATICYLNSPEDVYFIGNADQVQEVFNRIENAERWCFHNSQFDLVQFRRHAKFNQHKIFDIFVDEKILYSNFYDDFGLADMVRRYLKLQMHKDTRKEFIKGTPMTQEMIEYACLDTSLTAKIIPFQLKAMTDKLWYVHDEIDCPTIWAIMDFKGFMFNTENWKAISQADQDRADELYKGFKFNPDSPAQALTALRTNGLKSLTSTGAKVLARYKDRPLVKQLLEYREIARRASTYGMNFLNWVESDGRIHTNYKVYGAITGRIASDDPALQNMPELRRGNFIAAPGYRLIKGDFSAQEPRILAYKSQDKNLMSIILGGADIHTATARIVFHDSTITKADIRRKKAKAVGLGLDYGLTWRGLMQARDLVNSGIYLTEEEAQQLIRQYFDTFPGVENYIYEMRKFALENEYVETLLGRKCWINNYNWKGRNNAINSPIQGSGGDMIKLAIREIHEHWPSELGEFGIVETTHDDISIEVLENQVKRGQEFMRDSMLSAANKVCPNLPYEVDVAVSTTWSKSDDE